MSHHVDRPAGDIDAVIGRPTSDDCLAERPIPQSDLEHVAAGQVEAIQVAGQVRVVREVGRVIGLHRRAIAGRQPEGAREGGAAQLVPELLVLPLEVR